jgi:pilus assembly protein CpaC
LDEKIPTAQVNNPDILELTALSPTEIQISAKIPGVTQVNLWGENGQIYTIDVIVYADTRELSMILAQEFPNAAIKVKPISTGVLISGFVDQPEHVSTIVEIAEEYYPRVLTNMQVGGVHQVLLHIKVMEVSRTKMRALGLDWTQTSGGNVFRALGAGAADAVGAAATSGGALSFNVIDGGNSFLGQLEAMRRDSLAKLLAEPTLVTVSGRPAYFQSGGEVPVITGGGLGVPANTEYRPYGTEIDFVPIVLGNGRIRLEVRPRVSEIDPSRSQGSAPAFRTRQVDTAVELMAGQTLAIAGMIQSRLESTRVGIPWVSELPYLGMMFRRVMEDQNEIELLVMVTPELVGPMNPDEVPRFGPGLQTESPTDWQLFVRGHIEVPSCCQNCGGSGCDQCAAQAADGQAVAVPGMIGDGDGQVYDPDLIYSSESVPASRSGRAGRSSTFPAKTISPPPPETKWPIAPQMSLSPSAQAAGPQGSHNRSDRPTGSERPGPDDDSPPPGFLGPIGYDAVD